MSSVQLLQLLKSQLLVFFDELISIMPQEKDFLVIRFFIKDQVPISEVMDYIVAELVPLEEFVQKRDDRFFLEHQVLFESLKDHDSKVNYFKNLWQTADDENKDAIWNWFKCFIDLAKRYSQLR
jgi:hypothetical protein